MGPLRPLVAWCKAHPFACDAVLALAVAALLLPSLWGHPTGVNAGNYRDPDVFGLALLLLGTLPIAWRRVHPMAVLVVASFGLVAYEASGYPTTNVPLGALIALYTVASVLDRRRSLVGAAVIGVGLAIVLATARWSVDTQTVISNVVIFATVWFIGDNVQTRRKLLATLKERAEQAERDLEAEGHRAVVDERARLARELHDVVAHHMSVMILQTGAARRTLTQDPAKAADALTAVEATGREAMTEMRRMLGVLRAEDEATEDLAPQPSVRDLPTLVASCADAGLAVTVDIEGTAVDLPPGLDLSAYRIVQEALTNTLKHAGPASAAVRLRYLGDRLEVEISDDGRGASAEIGRNGSVGGHGLVGMRERVEVFGGELRAGPRPGGGYVIRARLPLTAGAT